MYERLTDTLFQIHLYHSYIYTTHSCEPVTTLPPPHPSSLLPHRILLFLLFCFTVTTLPPPHPSSLLPHRFLLIPRIITPFYHILPHPRKKKIVLKIMYLFPPVITPSNPHHPTFTVLENNSVLMMSSAEFCAPCKEIYPYIC